MSASGTPHSLRFPAGDRASLDDAALVARVQTGALDGFEALVRAWAKPLVGFASALLRSQADGEEVVQDLFVWIWDHRFEWQVQGALGAYLFRSVRNRAVSRMRHEEVEERFHRRLAASERRASEPVWSPAEQAVTAGELSSAIDAAIGNLSDRCREVFLLNRQQGLSYPQIAATLQISVKTVEIHMSRALSALRQALEAWM
jgi:RNA polymerase sigma-70 factor, ECF subfamily